MAPENAEARAARTRGEERRVGCAHSCPAGGVAEEKIASVVFVGSIPHVPYHSHHPPTRLPLCREQGVAIIYPFNRPSHVKRGRFSWVFAASA